MDNQFELPPQRRSRPDRDGGNNMMGVVIMVICVVFVVFILGCFWVLSANSQSGLGVAVYSNIALLHVVAVYVIARAIDRMSR